MDFVSVATLAIAMTVGPGEWDPYEITTDSRRVRSEAVELLMQQLADPKKARSAARRLIRFDRTAVPALRKALSTGDLRVRYYAASVLALMTDPEAALILLRVLADEKESPLIRRIAAGAMSRAGSRESIPVLVRLARRTYLHSDPERQGLRAAGTAHDMPDKTADDKTADDKARDVSHDSDDPLAGAPGEPFRYEVVKALAYMGAAEADRMVTAALADPSPRIREAAAQGLGDHRVRGAVGALRTALADPNAGVVREAARALGKFGNRAAPATEDLISLVGHEDAGVRAVARGALVLATGNSLSTAKKWQAWWKRRQERLAAEKAEAERTAEAGNGEQEEAEGEPRPSERPFKDEGALSSSSSSSSTSKPGGAPPALRPPWEWDDEDWTETREP